MIKSWRRKKRKRETELKREGVNREEYDKEIQLTEKWRDRQTDRKTSKWRNIKTDRQTNE